MICEHCHAENKEDALFCKECGKRLQWQEDEKPQDPAPQQAAQQDETRRAEEMHRQEAARIEAAVRKRTDALNQEWADTMKQAQKKARARFGIGMAAWAVICAIGGVVALAVCMSLSGNLAREERRNTVLDSDKKALESRLADTEALYNGLLEEKKTLESRLADTEALYNGLLREKAARYTVDVTDIYNCDSSDKKLIDRNMRSETLEQIAVEYTISSFGGQWNDNHYIDVYKPDGSLWNAKADGHTTYTDTSGWSSAEESRKLTFGYTRAGSFAKGLYLVVFYQEEEVIGRQEIIVR